MSVSFLRNDWVIALASAVIVYLYFLVVPATDGWQLPATLLVAGSTLTLLPISRKALAFATAAGDATDRMTYRFAGHATGKIAWVIVPAVLVAQPETLFIYLPLFLACSLFVPIEKTCDPTAQANIELTPIEPWRRFYLFAGVAAGIVTPIIVSMISARTTASMAFAIWALTFITMIATSSVLYHHHAIKQSRTELTKGLIGTLTMTVALIIT